MTGNDDIRKGRLAKGIVDLALKLLLGDCVKLQQESPESLVVDLRKGTRIRLPGLVSNLLANRSRSSAATPVMNTQGSLGNCRKGLEPIAVLIR
jgi:hypothetical protein